MIFTADIIDKIDTLPPVPAAMSRMAQALSDPDTDVNDIVQIIQFEPGLTAGVLKMANSAFFGSAFEIGSIRQAVTRLGLEQVFRLVVISSVSSTMGKSVAGYDLPPGELWRHSVAAALVTQYLAEAIGLTNGEVAFTAALVHDVGKLIIGNFLDVDFPAIEKISVEQEISFEEAERNVLGADHAEIGAAVLEKWNLPSSIVDAVRCHHNPDQAKGHQSLVDVVHVADALCLSMGLGPGRDGLYYRPSETSLRRCGLSKHDRESIVSRALGALDKFSELFSIPKREVYHGV